MKRDEQLDRLIGEQSSEWIEVMQRASTREREAFGTWLLDSRRHIKSFLLMTALDEELRHIDPERRFAVRRMQDCGNAEVIPLAEAQLARRERPTHRARTWPWLAGIAAGIAVLALTWTLAMNRADGWQEFATAIGEQRAVQLEDGSLVHLNTQSHVRVRLTAQSREIELLDGEALFKVSHEPHRPFRVHTPDAVIQAVGTQFNVYRRAEGTTVSVIEGRVQISAEDVTREVAPANEIGLSSLAAGEEARISASGDIARNEALDVVSVGAWRERRLVFKQQTLAEVVMQFNRYNRTPQFRVIGEEVATRRYSGVFDADDPDSLMQLLAGEGDLAVVRKGDEIEIRPRH